MCLFKSPLYLYAESQNEHRKTGKSKSKKVNKIRLKIIINLTNNRLISLLPLACASICFLRFFNELMLFPQISHLYDLFFCDSCTSTRNEYFTDNLKNSKNISIFFFSKIRLDRPSVSLTYAYVFSC